MKTLDTPSPFPAPALTCHWCGGPVDMPQRGWEVGRAAYCSAHHLLVGRDPWVIGQDAIADAEAQHEMDLEAMIQWPWLSVTELAGPLLPGRLTYIAAFPGNGKTSFLTHCLDFWLRQGKRITLLPLESSPNEVMTRLACLRLAATNQGDAPSADDALSGRLRTLAEAGDETAIRHRAELAVQYRLFKEDRDFLEALRIDPLESLTVPGFKQALEIAALQESDLVIVDHVDHVEAAEGEYGPEIAISNKLQRMALQGAKALGLPIILATQLNSSRTGNDVFAHYKTPRTDWLYNKAAKEQLASNILGLSRVLDPAADSETLDAVRQGRAPVSSVVLPNRMAVSGMKLRYGGARKERTAVLHYERGQISELAGIDRIEDEAHRHGMRLGSPSLRRIA